MSYLKLGNVSPQEFASKVEADFTDEEMAALEAAWSRNAVLSGDDQFHIFRDPRLSIHVGSASAPVLQVFINANSRKEFNQQVPVHVDRQRARAR